VRDDEWCGGCHREFEDKIVVRVRKKWPPRKEDLLVIRNLAQAVDNLADLLGAEGRQESWPQGNRFILEDERHRNGNSDVSPADRLENLKARSIPVSKPRNQN